MRHAVILFLLASGAVVAALGTWSLLVRHAPATQTGAAPADRGTTGRHWLVLLAILAVALAVRLEGLERRGMTHVEVYPPGIDLPRDVSEPPPRIGIGETVLWHFHDEPHPPGYYFFMWGWTRALGTSLTALRLPSVLAGMGVVALVFLLGRRLFDPLTGLLSAGLAAANGFQVYWSQQARMYVPSALLGLVSTLLLIHLVRGRGRGPAREAAYVAATWLAMFTQLLGWGLLAAQVLVTLRYARTALRVPRLLQLQALAAILGAPLLAHAVYRSRPVDLEGGPLWRQLQDYLDFGFLFEPEDFSAVPRVVPAAGALALTAVVLVLLYRARRRRGEPMAGAAEAPAGDMAVLMVAAGMSLVVLGLAVLAWRRNMAIALTAVVPLVAAALLVLARQWWPQASRVREALDRRQHVADPLGLTLLLALAPLILIGAVHLAKPVLTSRGAIIFVPYLLVAIGAGIATLGSRRSLLVPVLLALAATHAASLLYFRSIPTPVDYRGLAQAMSAALRPSDLVFIRARDWSTTPVFYHLPVARDRLVASGYEAALRREPTARVWVPAFYDLVADRDITAALASRRLTRELTARRARALLYEP